LNDIVASDDVVFGPGNESKAISYQVAQDFYNEITGKAESTTEYIKKPFILRMGNLELLHSRITQSAEQYNVQSLNSYFSVKYVDDSSERFSGIDRFRLHAGNKGLAIQEVDLVFNMLVVLPKTKRPQEYKLSISLVSRVARLESLQDDFEEANFDLPFFHLLGMRTGEIKISYVDITVANAFMSIVKSWVETLEECNSSALSRFARKHCGKLPVVMKYIFLSLASFVSYKISFQVLSGLTLTAQTTALFILFSLLFGFLAFRLGAFVGYYSSRGISRTYELSYIRLSTADEALVSKSSATMRSRIVKSSWALGSSFVIAVASTLAVGYLFYSFPVGF
jgi:hypothetical protein